MLFLDVLGDKGDEFILVIGLELESVLACYLLSHLTQIMIAVCTINQYPRTVLEQPSKVSMPLITRNFS